MYNGDCILIKDIKPGLKNINVIFIVLEIGAATVTKENREVRNFKVGDHTACINVSIWDEPGKLIAPGDIVKLTKGYASIWRHCLTLYSGKNGEVFKVGEFCMTFNEMVNMSEPKRPDQQQQLPTAQMSVAGQLAPQQALQMPAGPGGVVPTGSGTLSPNNGAANNGNTVGSSVISSNQMQQSRIVQTGNLSGKSTGMQQVGNSTKPQLMGLQNVGSVQQPIMPQQQQQSALQGTSGQQQQTGKSNRGGRGSQTRTNLKAERR